MSLALFEIVSEMESYMHLPVSCLFHNGQGFPVNSEIPVFPAFFVLFPDFLVPFSTGISSNDRNYGGIIQEGATKDEVYAT